MRWWDDRDLNSVGQRRMARPRLRGETRNVDLPLVAIGLTC
jgi:hypothetical protein